MKNLQMFVNYNKIINWDMFFLYNKFIYSSVSDSLSTFFCFEEQNPTADKMKITTHDKFYQPLWFLQT